MSDDCEREEDEAIAAFVRDRLAKTSGRMMSGIEFVRSLGFDEVAEEIRRERGK